MTLEEIEAAIAKADPNMDRNSDEFQAQLVMLASADQGTMDVRRLAKFTKVPVCLVSKFSHNLRKSGVWKGRKIYCDWFDETDGGMNFTLDTLVATGLMERSA